MRFFNDFRWCPNRFRMSENADVVHSSFGCSFFRRVISTKASMLIFEKYRHSGLRESGILICSNTTATISQSEQWKKKCEDNSPARKYFHRLRFLPGSHQGAKPAKKKSITTLLICTHWVNDLPLHSRPRWHENYLGAPSRKCFRQFQSF